MEYDGREAEIKSMTDMIDYLRTKGKPASADAVQKDLDAFIAEKPPTQQPTAKEAAKSLSTATTERARIIAQDATWQEQMLNKQTAAQNAIAKHQEMKEQSLFQLEEQHKQRIKSVAADYDNFVQIEKDKLTTYEEQVTTQNTKREEALATLNKEMKENYIEFESKPPAPVAANANPPPR